jgi:acyl-CoA reductase-like NAD-dependent aldehyde dehydrogenase
MSLSIYRSQLYINGKWRESAGTGRFDTINPANGSIITNVAEGNYVDVDEAVAAARVCLNSSDWGYASTGAQRAVFLRK